jgi:hypothetical protein
MTINTRGYEVIVRMGNFTGMWQLRYKEIDV